MFDLEDARRRDAADPLTDLRSAFELPVDRVYLDGNSLGALPIAARERVSQVVSQEWGEDLIDSWNRAGWIDLPRRVGDRIAPLLGAAPGQVVCADSISVNLFKLLASALQLQPGRPIILSEQGNFPTDLYMGQGLAELLGEERCQVRTVAPDAIENALGDDVAVLMLTHVNFRTGRIHDMRRLTARAHECGALVLWDLAHSAGVIPLELDDCGVDMAVGCGYKFLNGGPGAPAFLYLTARLQAQARQPLSGWMGHRQAFDFHADYEPAHGVERYLCGTPGIIGMSALDAALDLYQKVTITELRDRSMRLTQWFLEAVASRDELQSLQLVSPADPAERGSQVSLAHPEAYGITQALIGAGIVVDHRAPDIVRFGFAPLYTSFEDAARAVDALCEVMQEQRYLLKAFQARKRVT